MAHGRQETRLRLRRLFGVSLGRSEGLGLCTRLADIHPVSTPGDHARFRRIGMGLAAHPARAGAFRSQPELENKRCELARRLLDRMQDVLAVVFLDALQQAHCILFGLLPADPEQRLQVTGNEREAEGSVCRAASLIDHGGQVVGDFGQALFQVTPSGHLAAQPPMPDGVHQQRGEQHQQQRHAPAHRAVPVQAVAVLDGQPVPAQGLALARRHLQQQAVEGGGQGGMATLNRQHQLIVETCRCRHLQAPREAVAQQMVNQCQVAYVGIGVAIDQALQGLFRAACRDDPRLRRLLQHIATHAFRIGQQHPFALQVGQAQQRRAVTPADDHVRHADEGLAEHPVRAQVARIGRNAHHRLQLAATRLLAHLVPVMAVFHLQVGASLQQAPQVFAGQATGVAILVRERQRRRVRREADLQRLLQYPFLGLAQRQLCRCRPLRRWQPALHQRIALGLAGRSQCQVQCFGQRLLAVGNTEVQPFGRQIAGAQQHDPLQVLACDQFGGHVGIADVNVCLVVSDHLQRRQRAVCDKLSCPGKARPHLRAGQEVLLDHHPQSIQVGDVGGTQVIRASHQGQRCLAIGGGIDHAAGAVGTETDIHHYIDLATTCRIQHGCPVGIAPCLHLHAQLTGEKRQIIRAQADLLAITEGLERRPATVILAHDDARMRGKVLALQRAERQKPRHRLCQRRRQHQHGQQQDQPANSPATHRR